MNGSQIKLFKHALNYQITLISSPIDHLKEFRNSSNFKHFFNVNPTVFFLFMKNLNRERGKHSKIYRYMIQK